ncbi:MAG: hypothetical protein O9325_16460, partial [Roseomonas sp.]|nr:hypothetical protein [Roseomonas sp.]
MAVAPDTPRVDKEAFPTSISMKRLTAAFRANDMDDEMLGAPRDSGRVGARAGGGDLGTRAAAR